MGKYNVNRNSKYIKAESKRKLDSIEKKDAERIAYNNEHGTSYSYGMYSLLKRTGQLKI